MQFTKSNLKCTRFNKKLEVWVGLGFFFLFVCLFFKAHGFNVSKARTNHPGFFSLSSLLKLILNFFILL